MSMIDLHKWKENIHEFKRQPLFWILVLIIIFIISLCYIYISEKVKITAHESLPERVFSSQRPNLRIELNPGPNEYLKKDGNSQLFLICCHKDIFLVVPFKIKNVEGGEHAVQIKATYSSSVQRNVPIEIGEKSNFLASGEEISETFRPWVNISNEKNKEFPVELMLTYQKYGARDGRIYNSKLELILAEDRINGYSPKVYKIKKQNLTFEENAISNLQTVKYFVLPGGIALVVLSWFIYHLFAKKQRLQQHPEVAIDDKDRRQIEHSAKTINESNISTIDWARSLIQKRTCPFCSRDLTVEIDNDLPGFSNWASPNFSRVDFLLREMVYQCPYCKKKFNLRNV